MTQSLNQTPPSIYAILHPGKYLPITGQYLPIDGKYLPIALLIRSHCWKTSSHY